MRATPPSRRRFLAQVVVALNSLVGILIATPAFGYLLTPLLRRRSSQWVAIDKASKFLGSAPHRVTYRYRDERGYTVEQIRRSAFVVREGDELIVLSPTCTHMGCNVAFNQAAGAGEAGLTRSAGGPTRRAGLFECPCHGGRYDVSGRVVDGPPPRPLRRFETRLRDGNLEIHVT